MFADMGGCQLVVMSLDVRTTRCDDMCKDYTDMMHFRISVSWRHTQMYADVARGVRIHMQAPDMEYPWRLKGLQDVHRCRPGCMY